MYGIACETSCSSCRQLQPNPFLGMQLNKEYNLRKIGYHNIVIFRVENIGSRNGLIEYYI